MPNPSATLLMGILVLMALAGLFCFALMKAFMVVVRPNEVVIFFGGRYPTSDGGERNWCAISAGRRLRVPLVEQMARFDLKPMAIELDLGDVYAGSGPALRIQARALVRVSEELPMLEYAVERFLGADRDEIARIARVTLENSVCEVAESVAMGAEEMDRTRTEFAREICREAARDLEKLGLHLERLQIQKVAVDRDARPGEARARLASPRVELLED